MRRTLLAALLLPLTTQAQPPVADNYMIDEAMTRPTAAKLVWSDEFDSLDRSKWRSDDARNKEGWYNHERQYYGARPENVRIEQGALIIEARHETLDPRQYRDWGGQRYTSGKIVTLGKQSWTYGFFEIRAKLPCARGTWPAIWMMPDADAPWPEGGEIDIMEQVGADPNVVHATLHSALFVHTKGTQRGGTRTLPDNCAAYHRYQLDWQKDSITIGVDDRAFMRVRNDQPGGRGAWPFDRRFHLILNLAIGGDWGGAKGIDDAALPQRMAVDYVRVWQRPR